MEAFCQELPELGTPPCPWQWTSSVRLATGFFGSDACHVSPVGTAPRWRSVWRYMLGCPPVTVTNEVLVFWFPNFKNGIILEKGDCYCGGGVVPRYSCLNISWINLSFKHGTSEIDFGWPRSWGTTPVMASSWGTDWSNPFPPGGEPTTKAACTRRVSKKLVNQKHFGSSDRGRSNDY